MANANWGDIAASSIEKWTKKKFVDNMTDNIPLLYCLKQKGNLKVTSGGKSILEPIDYTDNSTFKYISGYEETDITPSHPHTAAEYNWKEWVLTVSMSRLEQIQNSGNETRMIDLLDARITNANRTGMNQIDAGVWSDGTGSSSKQIGGIQHLVSDTPSSGTVGGIDASAYTYWQNQQVDTGTATASTIVPSMNDLYVATYRNGDSVKEIFMDNNYWTLYLENQQGIQRITNVKTGQAGFETLMYMGARVWLAGGLGGNCPTSHMYFLNTDYIKFRTFYKNIFNLEKDKEPINQMAFVKTLYGAGNLTCSNRQLQGVGYDSA